MTLSNDTIKTNPLTPNAGEQYRIITASVIDVHALGVELEKLEHRIHMATGYVAPAAFTAIHVAGMPVDSDDLPATTLAAAHCKTAFLVGEMKDRITHALKAARHLHPHKTIKMRSNWLTYEAKLYTKKLDHILDAADTEMVQILSLHRAFRGIEQCTLNEIGAAALIAFDATGGQDAMLKMAAMRQFATLLYLREHCSKMEAICDALDRQVWREEVEA